MIDLIEMIAVSSVAMTAQALAETAGSELTFLGWRTLVVVGAADEPIRLSELADRLAVSRPSASKLVHRMARRGLLDLTGDAADGRGVRLGLSGEGSRLRHNVIERRRQLISQSMGEEPALEVDGSDLGALALAANRLGQWT